jgi:hypothetical protein
MRTTDSLRIGDAERDAAIAALTRHFTDGRLTQSEHEERIEAAMRARTGADLRRLFADLPRLGEPLTPVRRDRGSPSRAIVMSPLVVALMLALGVFVFANVLPVVVVLVFALVTTRIALGAWARPHRRGWRYDAWQDSSRTTGCNAWQNRPNDRFLG